MPFFGGGSIIPSLARGKRWYIRKDKSPPVKLDPLRNKHKKELPLFFGQRKKYHPVSLAGGSLSWAAPIFEMHKKKLEGIEEQKAKELHKLHAVKRLAPTLTTVPKQLRKILEELGLHDEQISVCFNLLIKICSLSTSFSQFAKSTLTHVHSAQLVHDE